MPTNLLAVDDSATIRKCLEITFGSDDFNVILAEGREAALSKAADAGCVLVDAVLGSDDGYALAKELRGRLPKAAIILLSSRYNPYDAAKGQDAGIDDFCDKPFDSQQLIDKAKKAISARASGTAASPAAPPPIPAAAAPASAGGPPPIPGAPASAPRAGAPGTGPKPTAERARTLMFGDGPVQPPAIPTAAAKAPPPVPVAAAATPSPAHAAPAAAPVAAGGDLHAKLAGLGLTKEQVEGVLALTRDVIEKAVWEVVPQMAEMMIKEEIERLTKD
ncbi:MAG: response regulator [Polyangiaceae bacterium]